MTENENFFRYRIFSLQKFRNKPKSYGLWKLWDNFWTCTNPPMHPIADKAKMVISVPLKIQNISSENSGVSYKIKIIFNEFQKIDCKKIYLHWANSIKLQFRECLSQFIAHTMYYLLDFLWLKKSMALD